MAHGEAARPIESKDGHDLAINPQGTAPVEDSRVVATLEAILESVRELSIIAAAAICEKPCPVSTAMPPVVIPSSTTVQRALGRNAERTGAVLYNDSSATAYVLIGDGEASATNKTYVVLTNTTLELPLTIAIADPISIVWASANGSAYITEFVRLRS